MPVSLESALPGEVSATAATIGALYAMASFSGDFMHTVYKEIEIQDAICFV
jgi:hypothetical protein